MFFFFYRTAQAGGKEGKRGREKEEREERRKRREEGGRAIFGGTRPSHYTMADNAAADYTLLAGIFTALGAAGNIALALAQVPLVLQMFREGSSDKYSPLPSLALALSFSLWCGYTVWFLPVAQLYAANFCGMIIPFCYLMCFSWLAGTPLRRAQIFFGSIFCLGVSWAFSSGVFLGPGVSNRVGVCIGVTAAVNATFFLAPLRPLYLALVELDISRVSLWLSMVQVVQSIVWMLAGFYLRDSFIFAMNSVGLGFALIQIGGWIFIFLRSAPKGGVALEVRSPSQPTTEPQLEGIKPGP